MQESTADLEALKQNTCQCEKYLTSLQISLLDKIPVKLEVNGILNKRK